MFRTDIESLLLSLATERRLFWSEADFQFAFAWKIQQNYPSAKIRLERRQEITNSKKPAYVDIWVELNNKIYPIELKYKTRTYQAKTQAFLRYFCRNSAPDSGRIVEN